MSEEEENNTQQPPAPAPPPPPPQQKLLGLPRTADSHLWARKWSTWLAVVGLMLDGAAGYFLLAPPEWRAGFPVSWGVGLLAAGMACKALIPLATSVRQAAP